MKFCKQYNLQTELTKSQILENINKVTESYHKELSKTQLFEGKVSGDSFKIYPTYDLRLRDHFRPEIEINLKEENSKTKVIINFSLTKFFKNFNSFAIKVNSIAQLVLLYFFFSTDNKLFTFLLFAPLIMTLFVYFLTKILFETRTKRALNHLTRILVKINNFNEPLNTGIIKILNSTIKSYKASNNGFLINLINNDTVILQIIHGSLVPETKLENNSFSFAFSIPFEDNEEFEKFKLLEIFKKFTLLKSYTEIPTYALNLGLDISYIEKTSMELLDKVYGFNSDALFQFEIHDYGKL